MLENRLPITDQGVLVPRVWFGDATEVELHNQNGSVVLAPLPNDLGVGALKQERSADDPLWRLFENPSRLDIADASENLDKYLYGTES